MILFCLYAALLLGLAALDARHAYAPAAFFVNRRASGALLTGASMLASCVGGTATIGMAGLAWQIGTPAFWWLGSGVCGLLALTLLLAKKIRASNAYTLPEMVGTALSPAARTLISVVILLAWTAILAAQFSAMSRITAALTGLSPTAALFGGAALITLYSLLGGQAAVIRSDLPQFGLLAAGLLLTLGWLCLHNPRPLADVPLEWLNPAFPAEHLRYFLLILGGSYVICPMLSGRLLSAKDTCSAARGGLLAVAGLALTAIIIVLIGIGCRGVVPAGTAPDAVLTDLSGLLPGWAGAALLLALLSAVLSSADSCLITAATVGCHDLLHTDRVAACRTAVLLLGCAGWLLAARGHGILELLLMANDIYVCGVVGPVFCGLLLPRRFRIRPGAAVAAVLLGGAGGLASACQGQSGAAYAGMALSALCVLAGIRRAGPVSAV